MEINHYSIFPRTIAINSQRLHLNSQGRFGSENPPVNSDETLTEEDFENLLRNQISLTNGWRLLQGLPYLVDLFYGVIIKSATGELALSNRGKQNKSMMATIKEMDKCNIVFSRKGLWESLETFVDMAYDEVKANSKLGKKFERNLPKQAVFKTLLNTFLLFETEEKLKDWGHQRLLSMPREDFDLTSFLQAYSLNQKDYQDLSVRETEASHNSIRASERLFQNILPLKVRNSNDLSVVEAWLEPLSIKDKRKFIECLQSAFPYLEESTETFTTLKKMKQKGYDIQSGMYSPQPFSSPFVTQTDSSLEKKGISKCQRSLGTLKSQQLESKQSKLKSQISLAMQNAYALKKATNYPGGGMTLIECNNNQLTAVQSLAVSLLKSFSTELDRPLIVQEIQNEESVDLMIGELFKSKAQNKVPCVAISISPKSNIEAQLKLWQALKSLEDTKNLGLYQGNTSKQEYMADVYFVVSYQKAIATNPSRTLNILNNILDALKSRVESGFVKISED